MGASPREGTSKPAKHPLPNPRLHPLDIGVRERSLPEPHRLLVPLTRLEYPVDHAAMEVDVLIERLAIPVQEANSGNRVGPC